VIMSTDVARAAGAGSVCRWEVRQSLTSAYSVARAAEAGSVCRLVSGVKSDEAN